MRRNRCGSTVIELAVTCVTLTVITLLCVDMSVVIFGTCEHDRCCREATRAASKAADQPTAMLMAQAALSASHTDGVYVTQPTFQASDMNFQNYGGSPLPNQVPTVTLTTHSTIKIPANIRFMQSSLFGNNGSINSTMTYVFPLTNVQAPVPSGP